MTLSRLDNVMQQYSCRCQNIIINAYDTSTGSTTKLEPDYHRVFVGEEGIHISHHYLTLRMRDHAQESETSPNKLLQHLALSCLACKTLAYRVGQEISRGYEAREGPVIPTEDWVEQGTLLSKSGWIEVFVGSNGCLVGRHAIERHSKSLHLSGTFSIGVISYSDPPRSPSVESSSLSKPWPRSSTPDSAKSVVPSSQLLPSLPPLLPPPPFTPSHPVFLYLSALATAKSNKLRQQAEDETRSFVQAKLEALGTEEVQLREEVEGIWAAYREGWKEVLSRANEERRRSLPPKSDASIPNSSARGGIPMSIRDFSPIVQLYPQGHNSPLTSSQSVPLPSTSLLSASLIQTGSHFPTSTAQGTNMSGTAQYSGSHTYHSPDVVSSRVNGIHSLTSSSSFSNLHGNLQFPGAFKRNMDTSVDIASSVAWVQGEEIMQRRFEGGKDGEPRERARNRTSKTLGISARKTTSARPTEEVVVALQREAQPDPNVKIQSNNSAIRDPTLQVQLESDSHRSSAPQTPPRELGFSSSTGKHKRRVTFDVQPEVTVVNPLITKQHSEPAAEVELFDLDDTSWGEPNQESQPSSGIIRPQPITRTPSYKLRHYDGASIVRSSVPGSLPNSRAIPLQSPENGNSKRIGGSTRRVVGLADTLPLLSSSVPAGDRILTQRSLEISTHEHDSADTLRTPLLSIEKTTASHTDMQSNSYEGRTLPSTSTIVMGPGEAELKYLLAASAPSHRHAWKEGGRAWEMFNQRARDKRRKVKGAIAEEGSDSTSSSVDDDSDIASGESLTTDGNWRNPSQYASSLPVQIRPVAESHPRLEPKTSLTDKQGVLVPPLLLKNSRLNSATAIRRAIYAERDRIRSIDPGPTLDFNERDEIEDEEVSHDADDGERGRRHALSILQARSVIPEAGMWRSMTS